MGNNQDRVVQKDRQCVSDEIILKIAKEISVKFIEVGKISPATFEMSFKDIYSTINQTVRGK